MDDPPYPNPELIYFISWWRRGCREEIVQLAKAIEKAGATIINTGIGWHEARIPTIATSVPRAGFSWVTKKLKGKVRWRVLQYYSTLRSVHPCACVEIALYCIVSV